MTILPIVPTCLDSSTISQETKILSPRYLADRLLKPTTIDSAISLYSSRTVVLDITLSRLQVSKKVLLLSLIERVEELMRENSELRSEIRYYQEILEPIELFIKNIKYLYRKLESCLFDFDKTQKAIEEDQYQERIH